MMNFLTLVLLLILQIWQPPQSRNQVEFHINGYAQGTTYRITYYAENSKLHKNEVDEFFAKMDSSLSIYKDYSLVSKFNKAPYGIKVDEHLEHVVRRSLEISRETGGDFDITVRPFTEAWGSKAEVTGAVPATEALDQMANCVGYQKLTVKGLHLQKAIPCLTIDVDGIAQGYSVDCLAKLLEKKQIKSYLVEIGGEIRVKGPKPDGSPFKVGIETPASERSASPVVQTVIQIDRGAITTSGNYRKYLERGGRKLSHTISAKTGRPVDNELISVTVLAKDAITADGFDNVFMLMGLEKSMKYLKGRRDLQAYFIYKKPNGATATTATTGFNQLIHRETKEVL